MTTIILYTERKTGKIRGRVTLPTGHSYDTLYPTRAALEDALQALARATCGYRVTLDTTPLAYSPSH